MASTNRFVKVDGTFERVGNRILPLAEVDAREQAGPLLGGTSNAAGSPLPLASATTTAPAPAQDPYDSFNLLMTDMLKSAQGLNTADLLKKKRTLERAAIDRTQEVTDRDMRTLAPSQQSAIRSGRTGALSSEIDENAYQLEKAQQSIDAFFRVHGEAQKIGQEWADKMVAPQSVITSAVQVIQADPDRMSTVLAGFNDKTKQKIIESLDYTKLSAPVDNEVLSPTEAQALGVPYGTTKAAAAKMGITPQKAPTEYQNKANLFANRLLDSETTIAANQEYVVGSNPAFYSAASTIEDTAIGNALIPDEVRQQRQAERNFINAVLRRESGAVISPTEFAEAAKQYFPRPGDDATTLAQKKQNRSAVQQALTQEAGSAFTRYGETERKSINGVEYEKVDGGWKKVSTAVGTNRPQRNNNPLNIKASSYTQSYPGVTGVDPSSAEDGGQFLTFATPEDGLKAAERLLRSEGYRGLTVDAAMRRWSGGGYGGDVAPQLAGKTVAALSPAELQALIDAMANREGFYA